MLHRTFQSDLRLDLLFDAQQRHNANMSQLAASDLVHEDSRRLVVDETELLQDELDAERELRRKGKLRDFDEDEEEQQDPQDETLLQPPRPVPSRHESYEYNSSDTKQVKRDKRRKYWQNAAVNVLFIASWYFFSSLISVYSKFKRVVALLDIISCQFVSFRRQVDVLTRALQLWLPSLCDHLSHDSPVQPVRIGSISCTEIPTKASSANRRIPVSIDI